MCFNVGMDCFFCSVFEKFWLLEERGEDMPFRGKKSEEKFKSYL